MQKNNRDIKKDKQKIIELWKEHLNEIPNKHSEEEFIYYNVEITILYPLVKLKNKKRSGEDTIIDELLKYSGEEMQNHLLSPIKHIWNVSSKRRIKTIYQYTYPY